MVTYKINGDSGRRQEIRRVRHDQILIDDEWEVIYWCLVLKCTKERLVESVRQLGSSPDVIRESLTNGHQNN